MKAGRNKWKSYLVGIFRFDSKNSQEVQEKISADIALLINWDIKEDCYASSKLQDLDTELEKNPLTVIHGVVASSLKSMELLGHDIRKVHGIIVFETRGELLSFSNTRREDCDEEMCALYQYKPSMSGREGVSS